VKFTQRVLVNEFYEMYVEIRMTRQLLSALFFLVFMVVGMNAAYAEDDEFVPAYQNEGNYQLDDSDKYFQKEDPNKYVTYRQGRKYYTSGKKNGFRINENNEESTDETVGILTFPLVPATLVYMNIVGWWD